MHIYKYTYMHTYIIIGTQIHIEQNIHTFILTLVFNDNGFKLYLTI